LALGQGSLFAPAKKLERLDVPIRRIVVLETETSETLSKCKITLPEGEACPLFNF
jgi:hypothetical protein